jgi:hypothetical protein
MQKLAMVLWRFLLGSEIESIKSNNIMEGLVYAKFRMTLMLHLGSKEVEEKHEQGVI